MRRIFNFIEIYKWDVRKSMDVNEHLDKMEKLVITQVRDEKVRKVIMDKIENDRRENIFSFEGYMEFYGELDKLGKVQMDVWRSDIILRKFYGSLAVVRAAVRFKKGLKNS